MSIRGGGMKRMHVWKSKMEETSGKRREAELGIFMAPRDMRITGGGAKEE